MLQVNLMCLSMNIMGISCHSKVHEEEGGEEEGEEEAPNKDCDYFRQFEINKSAQKRKIEEFIKSLFLQNTYKLNNQRDKKMYTYIYIYSRVHVRIWINKLIVLFLYLIPNR